MKTIPLWARWLASAVILCGALFIGSGVLDETPMTNSQRATVLENQLKCPACQDLSVAQSSSASSRAVRAQIKVDIARGMSDSEIIDQLTARYGNAVLLTPPAGGISNILWAVPVGIVVVAAGVIVLIMRRRKQPSQSTATSLEKSKS